MRALDLGEEAPPKRADVECPYCQREAIFFPDSKAIYKSGKDFGPMWVCIPCHAWVGCHPGTKTPLGWLADEATRRARQEAHRYFDFMWLRKWATLTPHRKDMRVKGTARRMAYEWLAKEMGLSEAECHIGQFDAARCDIVCALCKPFYRPDKLTGWAADYYKAGEIVHNPTKTWKGTQH